MHLIEKIYREVVKATTNGRQDEFFAMALYKDALPLELFMESKKRDSILTACAVSELVNQLCPPCQLVSRLEFVTLPITYRKALAALIPTAFQETEDCGQKKIAQIDAELLEELKDIVISAQSRLPDGTAFYPAKLHPADWMDTLVSGFQHLDFLKSFNHYLHEYKKKAVLREALVKNLLLYSPAVEKEGLESLNRLKELHIQILQELPSYGIHFMGAFPADTVLPASAEQKLINFLLDTYCPDPKAASETKPDSSVILASNTKALEYETAILDYIRYPSGNESIAEVKRELTDVLKSLLLLRQKLYFGLKRERDSQEARYYLLPHRQEESYDPVVILSNYDSLLEPISLECQEKNMVKGLHGLFPCGMPVGIKEEKLIGHLTIQVGFLVKRIGIEREWFCPDIFGQPQYTSIKEAVVAYAGPSLKHRKKREEAIFPVYPESIVLAKDITLRFLFDDTSVECMDAFYHHLWKCSGFLTFGERYQDRVAFCDRDENMMTCKYDWAQLLGYYMAFIPQLQAEK